MMKIADKYGEIVIDNGTAYEMFFKESRVKCSGNRFFVWSIRAGRHLPVKKSQIEFKVLIQIVK